MAVTEKEAVASLKLLVALAKADGALSSEERTVLEDALKSAKLPAGTTPQSLLDGEHDADAAIREIVSPDARDAAFSSCFAMAYADRKCLPQEQAILDRIEKAWAVPKEKKSLFGRVFEEAKDTVSWSRIQPIADPKKRDKEVNEDVMKYSVLSAVLGANPLPIASIATDLAIVGVQGKMVRDIGQYWGREPSKEGVKQLLAGMGVGHAGRIALTNLLKFVPVLGSVSGAAAAFASTWAAGRVANQFYLSGGKLDGATLKDMFRSKEKEGRAAYEENKAAVEAKQRESKKKLDQLAADHKAGKITLAEYEKQVAELK